VDPKRQQPRLALALGYVLACTLALGCRAGKPRDAAPGANRYALKGTVVEVNASARSVTLAHDEIPGFMPAMTMAFDLRDPEAALLRTMAPGDAVAATLVVSDSSSWLESVVVTRPPGAGLVPAAGAPMRQPQPGDAAPDVVLTDQSGRPLRLAEYRGRALALTFVFTRCPMPEYCPFLMRGFAGAHAALVADPSLAQKTALLTVSFDVGHDTPKVLLAYGRPFQKTEPPFSHWRLATGRLAEVRTLGAAFGLQFSEEDRSFSHNLRTAIIAPDGRLRRLFTGNDWTSDQLIAELTAALGD
jgi:protein SCO1/2